MARRAALIACALLVLGGHAVLLEWLARQWREPPPLPLMAQPLFTRLLTVSAPVPPRAPPPRRPPPAAHPLHAGAPAPAPVAVSTPAATTPTVADALPAATVAATPEPAISPDPSTAPSPDPAASSPAAPAPDPLAGWPADTRLSYVLRGWYRGELQGDARVQWQRTAERYQVRVDVVVSTFMKLTMTSQGQATPQGLRPAAYEETRTGRGARAVRLGETDVTLENGRVLPRPDGVQDTASQFVELAYRFANQLQPLQLGGQVSFPMARPGAIDLWTYDVVERVMLQTPKLGAVEAFHLKPRPIANPRGNITAEMWFAPGLQYLPVRIRINQGSDVHLDLLVDKIEQR